MTYDFEGKTEKEAIQKAMMELGLDSDSFDVEILEEQRGGLFKKGYVKIRLHIGGDTRNDERGAQPPRQPRRAQNSEEVPPNEEFESKLIAFTTTLLEKMGTHGTVAVLRRERRKIMLNIETTNSAIVIGKKGRTLDALQLLATLYTKKIHQSEVRVIIDCEEYRQHHEDALIRLAYSVAEKARHTRRSILLDPMNPYDRRLVHTTLDREDDIETKSEGEGVYKQVRVIYRHSRR